MNKIIDFILIMVKKIIKWYQHDRDAKWYTVLFAFALWFFLLSENYAQEGYSWQRVWDQPGTAGIINAQQLPLPSESMPNAILEKEYHENEKLVKGGN